MAQLASKQILKTSLYIIRFFFKNNVESTKDILESTNK